MTGGPIWWIKNLCALFHTMTAGFNADKLSAMWLHSFLYFLLFAYLHRDMQDLSDIATVSAHLGLPLAPSETVLAQLMHCCLGTEVPYNIVTGKPTYSHPLSNDSSSNTISLNIDSGTLQVDVSTNKQ